MRSPATIETAVRAEGRREPVERGERILTTLLAALLGSVILGFIAIAGQLISMQRQMHEEIGGLRNEMHEEIGGVRSEIGELREEMREEFGELRSGVGALSERVARIETFLQIHHGPLPGP